jgi:hypothetical protein
MLKKTTILRPYWRKTDTRPKWTQCAESGARSRGNTAFRNTLKSLRLKVPYCGVSVIHRYNPFLEICLFWHHKWACPPRCVLDISVYQPTQWIVANVAQLSVIHPANDTQTWWYDVIFKGFGCSPTKRVVVIYEILKLCH